MEGKDKIRDGGLLYSTSGGFFAVFGYQFTDWFNLGLVYDRGGYVSDNVNDNDSNALEYSSGGLRFNFNISERVEVFLIRQKTDLKLYYENENRIYEESGYMSVYGATYNFFIGDNKPRSTLYISYKYGKTSTLEATNSSFMIGGRVSLDDL